MFREWLKPSFGSSDMCRCPAPPATTPLCPQQQQLQAQGSVAPSWPTGDRGQIAEAPIHVGEVALIQIANDASGLCLVLVGETREESG